MHNAFFLSINVRYILGVILILPLRSGESLDGTGVDGCEGEALLLVVEKGGRVNDVVAPSSTAEIVTY